MAARLIRGTPLRFQPWSKINTTIHTTTSIRCIATSQTPTVQVWSSLQSNQNHNNDTCIDYCRGWAWQQILLSRRLEQRRQPIETTQEDRDLILLLEHNPVYTLGRGASEEHLTFLGNNNHNNDGDSQATTRMMIRLSRKYRGSDAARLSVDRRSLEDKLLQLPTLEEAVDVLALAATPVMAPNGVPIFRVDRGGEVTFHGPQQLVIYPMLDLKRDPFQADLHWFLRQVEEVVIQTLLQYDIVGVRDEINTGVWVEQNKIAAVGVSASSWISSHGLALNVSPDLNFFDTSVILPCGIKGRGVTSIQRELGKRGIENPPTVQEVASVALRCIENIFQVQIDYNDMARIH